MQFYIVKKEDTLDIILNKFGLTYQKFISLNNSNIKELIKEGNKVIIKDYELARSFNDNITKIYEETLIEKNEEMKYICPHCKNIIIIPKL